MSHRALLLGIERGTAESVWLSFARMWKGCPPTDIVTGSVASLRSYSLTCCGESPVLTFFREVILLCFSLHLFAPAFHPLRLCVQQFQKPRAISPARRHPPCLHCVQGWLQPGIWWWQSRSVHLCPVVLPVTEEALRPHSPQCPILGRGTGF